MASSEFRVRVLLSPQEGSEQIWPCPAGVKVQFKKRQNATWAQAKNGQTDAEGRTDQVQLDHLPYEVRLSGPGFDSWTTGEIDLSEEAVREETVPVRLYPQEGCCALELKLTSVTGAPVSPATVQVTAPGAQAGTDLTADENGRVLAAVQTGPLILRLGSAQGEGGPLCPRDFLVPYSAEPADVIRPLEIVYWPEVRVVVQPRIPGPDGSMDPLTGAEVTVRYQVDSEDFGASRTKILTPEDGAEGVSFSYSFPGLYTVSIKPPATVGGLAVQPLPPRSSETLSAGTRHVVADFDFVPTTPLTVSVQTPDDRPLDADLGLEVSDGTSEVTIRVDAASRQGTGQVPADADLVVGLAGPAPEIGGAPLSLAEPGQVVSLAGATVGLVYDHSITIRAVDDHDRLVPDAVIMIFDAAQKELESVVTGADGRCVVGVATKGTYYVMPVTSDGRPVRRMPVSVNSNKDITVVVPSDSDGEALTDLSAYPVLTEEVSTTGPPAPVSGGGAGGGSGAGYGQTVDQVMRDVLGWRPGRDAAGFQAALTGAFQLREVEGHREWTWQQRGYAVQADMGALTGAQASIYARAKAALDQIQPLLAGVTALNPALYPPQDLEAIRTIISAELQELVTELALPGGPRIERVNELFKLLSQESLKSTDPNPDHVQGHLGTMRERFGLTEEWVDTVDEERILTNFRVVVEQVLALKESWTYDRKLLTVDNPASSLGTILTWLSRGLEAVCESVDDLNFALDSVYVDAAQRQVITLSLPSRPGAPMLLSDLLDWVTRANQTEGPQIIQDGGKDGVQAFAPVLATLTSLVNDTRSLIRDPRSTLPDGLRTPRVLRAFQVLAAQLKEASRLAGLIQRYGQPQITDATVFGAITSGTTKVNMICVNVRRGATAFLVPENRDDIADVPARSTIVTPPASATFRVPRHGASVTWLVMVVNEDGTESLPAPIRVLKD